MPPKARVPRVAKRPAPRKGTGTRPTSGRERMTLQLEGKMAQLYRGELTVADMDTEELARLQFKDRNGNFTGRPPQNLPAQLVNMMRKEMINRLAEQRREVLEEMQKVLIGIAKDGEKDADRIKAANIIIERELGKTPEKVELSTGDKGFEVTMTRAIRMRRPGASED